MTPPQTHTPSPPGAFDKLFVSKHLAAHCPQVVHTLRMSLRKLMDTPCQGDGVLQQMYLPLHCLCADAMG